MEEDGGKRKYRYCKGDMRDGRRNGKEEREGEQKKKEGGKNLVETRSKEKN